jgi:cytidylate kinase
MSNPKKIITISQEEGSGGREIARFLAQKLKLRLVDEQLIRAAYLKLGITYADFDNFDEKVLPKLVSLNTAFDTPQDYSLSEVLAPDPANFGYMGLKTLTPHPIFLTKDSIEDRVRGGYQKLVDKLIREIAEQGQVLFLDLGANLVLKHWPQIINIRIVAPFEDRVERLALNEKVSQDQAITQICAHDQQQEAYIREFYGPDCTNPALYHLVVNTSYISLPAVTNAVYKFVREYEESYHQVDALEVRRSYNRLVAQESYTLDEASHLLWIDPDILRKAVYQGELKGKVIDHNVIRVSRQALVDWLRLNKIYSNSERAN